MKKTRLPQYLALSILIGFIFGTALARADIFMKQKRHSDPFQIMGRSQPGTDTTTVFWIGENKVRTDFETAKTSTILMVDKKLAVMIDHAKRQYSEMPLDLDKIFKEDRAGTRDDQEKTEVTITMHGRVAAKGGLGWSANVTETGETKKIGDWNCRKYLIEMNIGMGGVSTSEAWATEDLKVDYTTAFAAANGLRARLPGFEQTVREMKKVKGFIVLQRETVRMMGAEVKSTTELAECVEKDAPAGTYDIPAGYKKVKADKI